MKKKYVIPTVKVIYTMMESTLLAGSPGNTNLPGGTGGNTIGGGAKPNYSIEELPNNEEYEDNEW
ncbi:hypothetical protein [Hallella colorans]|uniref:hypothetical protein n=1 Tax=Hallella colorans TaxID=1703337 RepID=UPI00288BDC33|nr:hypothetical protein [Hallella colorans]